MITAARGVGVGAKPRKVQELEPGYFKPGDWMAGTGLGRDGFKKLMQLELRRQQFGGGRGEGGLGGGWVGGGVKAFFMGDFDI
jgi:hypothetical protein